MNEKIYIGIDNGTTGTIGIVGDDLDPKFFETPVKVEQSYTKAKNKISRVDHESLKEILGLFKGKILAIIERPMINPMRFKASISAARSLESILIAIEDLKIPHIYIDSREWQKKLLPQGCEGKELKTASMDIGCRLFPELEIYIRNHKDADGLLIAEWARRENL